MDLWWYAFFSNNIPFQKKKYENNDLIEYCTFICYCKKLQFTFFLWFKQVLENHHLAIKLEHLFNRTGLISIQIFREWNALFALFAFICFLRRETKALFLSPERVEIYDLAESIVGMMHILWPRGRKAAPVSYWWRAKQVAVHCLCVWQGRRDVCTVDSFAIYAARA